MKFPWMECEGRSKPFCCVFTAQSDAQKEAL